MCANLQFGAWDLKFGTYLNRGFLWFADLQEYLKSLNY